MENPLKNFDISTFIKIKIQEENNEYNKLILNQANDIHVMIKNARLKDGCIIIPAWKLVKLYEENVRLLKANGFQILEITEAHQSKSVIFLKSYIIKWDKKDIRTYFDDYMEFEKKNGDHIIKDKTVYKEL
jgi:hypothetical protein